MKKNKIFLSYAHKDAEFVSAIEPKLPRLLNIDSDSYVVFDAQSDIRADENIRERIRAEMDAAETVVIVNSSHSDSSEWQSYEIGMAEALGKNVVFIGEKGVGKSMLLEQLTNQVGIIEIDEE